MKRLFAPCFFCALLSCALLVTALTLPAAAVTKVRGYPGFSDIPSTENPYFNAVSTCYEAGLMNGTSETTFEPQGNLSIAQLVVLAARLYNIQQGGKGEIPALPTESMMKSSFLRFYDENGKLLKSYKPGDMATYNGLGGSFFISLSETPDDPALPKTCTMEVGLKGYGTLRRYEGTRESYNPLPGFMNQGFSGTGYRFLDESAAAVTMFFLGFDQELTDRLNGAWWFPAAFYLASEGCFNLSGDLIYRANSKHAEDYDPLTGFKAPASRAFFAWLVDAVTGELPVVNKTVAIPDVTEETQDAEAILRLYRAGVLTGVDAAGNFKGNAPLTRGQAAILLARVIEPTARKGGA